MRNVVFVAPFFLPATVRFVQAAADLDGVRLGLISQDPVDRLPPDLRRKLAADWRIEGLEAQRIADAVRGLSGKLGGVDRLFGALEHLQVPIAEVREHFGIEGMDAATANNFRDKARMKTVLRAAGVACARHGLARTADEARTILDDIGYPVVAKPPDGAGAKNTFRLDRPEQLEQLLQALPPHPDRPLLIEEFIIGEEHSFDSVVIGGEPVWFSASDYFPSPLEVMENPWIQWCVLLPRAVDVPQYEEIRNVAAEALKALGLVTGLSHMEWFRREDGSVAVSEVGARPPGAQFTTLLSYAHELDFYRAWARLMVFDEFDPPERRYAAGAAYLRGQGQGRVKAVHGLAQAQRELGELVVEANLPQPGQPASGSYEGEGYVILRHPETDVVERGLKRLVQLLQVELTDEAP